MGRKGKSVRLERGIFETATRYRVVVKRGKTQREKLFLKSTTRQELRNERASLTDTLEAEIPLEGSFAADAQTFLATIGNPARRADLARLLKTWVGVFGDQPRDGIATVTIDTQLAQWDGQPKKKTATRRNLRQALGQFYRKMNGKGGRNPVADAAPIKPIYDDPRALPYDAIARVLNQIHDRRPAKKGQIGPPLLTKIRLRIMAYTGLTQAMLGRIQARDVNLRAKEMYVRPRRKGGGAPARTLGLTPPALSAFRDINRAKAWGPFSTSSMAKTWNTAVRKARALWAIDHPRTPWPGPDDLRAYDLRHSFGSLVYAETGDQRAVSELLLHSTLDQSTRYTQAVASKRSRMAIASVGGKLGTSPGPAFGRRGIQKTPQNASRLQRKRSA